MTHAFFKALLFMTAGLAIHALAGEQDIRQMRGLGKLMPFTKWCFLAGALALVGIPPFSGFFSKDSIVASAAALGTWYGWIFWVCGIAGAFLTGLYTFRLWFLVFPGEPSPFVREHYHDHHGREGAWTMLVPVGVLAVLATVGGWLQWSPHWHPFTDWLAPAAPTLAVAEPTIDAGVLHLGRDRARRPRRHRASRGRSTPSRRSRSRPPPFWRRTLEHKFYFDELYDRIFYAPAVAIANGLRREFEEPVSSRRGTDLGETTLETGGLVRRIQTGLLRTYVLFLAARRRRRRPRLPDRQMMSASSLTSILIWLPIAGAILIWLLPLSRYATGSLAMLFSLAEVGFWIEQAARFDFSRSGLQMEERANWFGDLGVSYHVGVYGFSLWLVGLTVVAMAACTGYGFWVGRDRPRALLRADAPAHRRDGRRVRGAGSAPLLRLLRGDADPALHPDRRLGRRAADGGDDQVRHLHDGGLAAHARRDRRLRPQGRDVRPRGRARRARAAGSSSASWSPS